MASGMVLDDISGLLFAVAGTDQEMESILLFVQGIILAWETSLLGAVVGQN